MNASSVAVCCIGGLHFFFMIGELVPWERPAIMTLVIRKWKQPLDLSANDKQLLSMVVHNAGVYNGIVAAGLFASLIHGSDAFDVQVALLSGGVIAGLFGAATLSKATIVQAIFGAIALAIVVRYHA